MNTKSSENKHCGAITIILTVLTIIILLLTARSYVNKYASENIENTLFTTDTTPEVHSSLAALTLAEQYVAKTSDIVFPLDGRITSGFAWRDDPFFDESSGGTAYTEFHRGIDISAARSRDIHACADGIVCFVGSGTGYGNYLMIDHGEYVSLYAHCSEILVNDGDTVLAGTSIAVAGATGRATGPHLHFEIRVDGQVVDPLEYVGSVYAGASH